MARFGALLDQIAADSFAWENVSPVLQRRRKPAGGYEYRPNPARGQGGPQATTPAQEKRFLESAGDLANRAITASAEGLAALPELLLSRNDYRRPKGQRVVHPDVYGALTPDAIEGEGGLFDLKAGREDIHRQYEERKEEFRGANLNPRITAVLDTLAEAVGPAEGLALARAGAKAVTRSAASLLDPTKGIEGAVAREFSGVPTAAPRTRGAATLARTMGREKIGEPGASGRRESVTLDEDGRPRFDWRRQGGTFPPDLDPWIRGKGIDPDGLSVREKLDYYGQLVEEEKAGVEAMHARPREEPTRPPLSREEWQRVRDLPASRLAAGNRLVEEGLAKPSEAGSLRIGPDPVKADPATEAYRASVFREEAARPSIPERLTAAKDRLLVEFVSASDPYVTRMARAGAGEEAEILAHELRRAGHTALTPITYSTRRWDPATRQWEFTGAPLEKLSAQMDEATQRQVEAVMVAQSQVEFAGREALVYQKRLAEAGAEGAGVEPTSFARTKEARDYLAQMQAAGELERLKPHLDALRDFEDRAFLQPLERLGVLSKEAADEIRRTNQHHAVMMIAEDKIGPELRSGEAVATRTSPVKRREAGLMEDEQYVPTFEAMAMQAARVDKFQVRQLVRNDLAERVMQSPDLWPEMRPAKPGEAGTFVAWKDGKQYAVKAPGELLDVIDNIRPEQTDLVWKAARASAQVLRTLATLAPHFPGMNFLRDQATAAVFSQSKKLFGFVPYYDPAKVLFQEVASRMTGKGATQAWKDFQASAAGHSTFLRADREGMARAMEEARLRATPQGRRTLLAREAVNPLFVPATAGNALESATRVAERNILLKEGAGAREATRGSAKVSLDFSDGGRFTKKVNEVVAFFNVRFLDPARFIREIRRRPFTIAARATAFITLPALAEEWLHRDDPGYHNLPLWDQAAFYHVGRSTEGFSEGWYKRIPRPLGLVSYVFGLLPQLALRQAIKEDPHAAELAMRGLLQDTPAGLMFAQNEQGGIQPSTEWVPTIGKGAADLVANRKWTGAPIVGDERLPAREQWTDRTSPLVREMAHAMPEAAPDFLESPQQLEHLISQQTAGSGRLALDLLNPATRAATGEREPPREPPSPRDVPIVRNFMSAPPIGFESQPATDLYRFTDRADALADQLRRFEGTDRERAKDLLARYPKVVDAAAVGADAREQMGIWRKERERIKAQQIPGELKRARLRALDMRVTAYAERQMKEWRKRYPELLQ